MLKGKDVPPDGHHLEFQRISCAGVTQGTSFPSNMNKNNQNVMRRCGVNHTPRAKLCIIWDTS